MWKKNVEFDVFKLFLNIKGEKCLYLVIYCRFLIVKMVFFSMSKVNLGKLNSFLRKLFDYDLVWWIKCI